ncbi:MAG: hypothetical protein M1415_00130 [Firmicutes bacterium]|nr:hypothetical protein [Bacillota bacterium]
MPKADLQRFVLDALHQAGGIAEPKGYGLTEVLVPQALAERLNIPPLVTLAFESEAAREEPHALLVTYGHPLVDDLIAYILERQRGFRFYAHLEPHDYEVSSERALALVEETLEFRKTRRPAIEAMSPVLCYDFSFGFRVTWQSSSRIEETLVKLVDGNGNALAAGEAAYDRVFWANHLGPHEEKLPSLPPVAFQTLWQKASVEIESLARHRAKDLVALDQGKYDTEYQRMSVYYNGTLKDLDDKIAKAPVERKEALAERRQAVLADRDRRLADLRAAYDVDHQVALDHVRMFVVPRVAVSLRLQQKTEQLPAHVLINLLTRGLDPFPCQRCGLPTVTVSWEGRWVGDCCQS